MASESEDDQPGGSQASSNGSNFQGTGAMPLFSCAKFRLMSRSLSMPVDIQEKAEGVLETLLVEMDQQDDIEMSQIDMFVCALYMALIEARMPYGPHDPQLKHGYLAVPPVSITQLLQKSNTSVKQLLQKMRQVKELILLSEAVTEHLTSLERNFCVMCALSHTFDRLCRGVFREEDKPNMEANEENIPMLPETEGVAFRQKMGWLLFVHAKKRLMGDNLDLLNGFQALLCCLEYVMRTTPSFLLNDPYDVIRIGCSEYRNISMLSKLCEQFGANPEETEDMCLEPLFQELLNREGELDLDSLEESYLKQHASQGDLNEMLFLTKDPLFFPSNEHSNGSGNIGTNLQPPMTPVRATLNSVQQLKSVLATAADKPSTKLQDYFQICTNNPGPAIAERVQRMRELFVSSFVRATTSFQSVAEPRFTLGVKLYYLMLELLLNSYFLSTQDSKRLSVSVLDTLLNKEDFHSSLLACSLEVVLVAYGLTRSLAVLGSEGQDSPFSFPWILEVLLIQAYDFHKVLESFIRVEPTLPSDVVKHLQNIEYRILDSIAWKENSSLFEVIRVCDRGLSTPLKNSPTERFSSGNSTPVSLSAAQMFLSPVPPHRAGQGASASSNLSPATSPAKTTPVSSPAKAVAMPHRSQSLTSFFNKVCRLAYNRLQTLCALLQVNRDVLHKIWTCVENCLNYKHELMKNRHLDQILMCSVYGVCKVMERELRFKTIVQEYRNLPHADPNVFRNVHMGGDRSDSIISFYNQLFMENMKSCLQQFSSSRMGVPTLSPVPQPVSPQPLSPGYSVMGRKNFRISPLKESPFKAPRSPSQLTPMSHTLYCKGDLPGPSDKFRKCNDILAASKRRSDMSGQTPPKEKARRLIQFDQDPSKDNQLSSSSQ